MAKDALGNQINVGDVVKIIGVISALKEPNQSNRGNVVLLPKNTTLKDMNGNVMGMDARTITISGSVVTKGV